MTRWITLKTLPSPKMDLPVMVLLIVAGLTPTIHGGLYPYGYFQGDTVVTSSTSSWAPYNLLTFDKRTNMEIEMRHGRPSKIVSTDAFDVTPFLSAESLAGALNYLQVMSLTQVDNDIAYTKGRASFQSDFTLRATWSDLYDYSGNGPYTHQAILAANSELQELYIIFIYGSMGNVDNGQSYINITGSDAYFSPGSKSADFRQRTVASSNINVPGKWVFQYDHSNRKLITSFAIGPSRVTLTVPTTNMCRVDSNDVITVHCDVRKTDVSPEATVTLLLLDSDSTEKTLSATSSTTDEDKYRYSFRFRPVSFGQVNTTCVAKNVYDESKVVKFSKTFQVGETIKAIPMVTLNGLAVRNDTGPDTVLDGETVQVGCGVDGETDEDVNATITCADSDISRAGETSVSATMNVTREIKSSLCVCRISGDCYGESQTQVYINATYGPSAVVTQMVDDEVTLLPGTCTTNNISLYCDVTMDDVYPMASAVIQVDTPNGSERHPPRLVTTESGLYRHYFSFSTQVVSPWKLNVKCIANNTVQAAPFSAEHDVILNVPSATQQAPIITRDDKAIVENGGVECVQIGHVLSYACSTPDLDPYFNSTSLNLTCGNMTTSMTSPMTIHVTEDFQNSMCVCRRSGCFEAETSLTINVSCDGSSCVMSRPLEFLMAALALLVTWRWKQG